MTDDALVGRRVNKYEIVRFIGRGGMGTVFEALNTSIGKRVAMKFVDAEMAKNKDAVARFHREAQAASAVESAHIVEIFDSGFTDDERPYIVMELLRGEDLGHRIRRCGRLELAEALHITAQILRGLRRAHDAGIIHRDLKPDNIFLLDRDDDSDFAKILDFGISKVQRFGEVPAKTLTREGTVLGTPFYMAPEQAQALNDIDGRADLWSVGAILYECLTGRPPHSGTTYEQVIINICMKDADDIRAHNPAVPEVLAKAIAKGLARERNDRFGSAREFLDALVVSSGGILPARYARGSGDEMAGSDRRSAARSTPSASGRTPVKLIESELTNGFEPTIELPSNAPSKVGWSTRRSRETTRRSRNLYLLLGAAAAVATVAATFLMGGNGAASDAPPKLAAAPAPATPAEVSMRLRSNVEGARFLIDGAPAPDGVVKGFAGETKNVRVEADGFTTVMALVTLDPAKKSMEILLAKSTSESAPTAESGGTAGAASGGPAKATANKVGVKKVRPPTSPPSNPSVPATSPSSGGVANGLTIKPD